MTAAHRRRLGVPYPGIAGLGIPGLAVAFLLASAAGAGAGAGAQVSRNGPEYGGKDHQPTQDEVIQRERQAGTRPPEGQVDQNQRTLDQLDQKLLREEGLDTPRSPPPAAPR